MSKEESKTEELEANEENSVRISTTCFHMQIFLFKEEEKANKRNEKSEASSSGRKTL